MLIINQKPYCNHTHIHFSTLQALYNYGAKKVALYSLLPIGCAPSEIARYGTNGALCVEHINAQVVLFNSRLRSLVDELNNNFKDAKFIYVNLYDLALAAIMNPAPFGKYTDPNLFFPSTH